MGSKPRRNSSQERKTGRRKKPERIARIEFEEHVYFSAYDEEVFYTWLGRIRSISKIAGRLTVLYIDVDLTKFDRRDLREFLAVFRRYGVDLRVLAVLAFEGNRRWFKDKKKWWYWPIFRAARMHGS